MLEERPDFVRPISEATRIQLSITSWFHVICIIITIVACYFGLQASITQAVQASQKNTNDLSTLQTEIFAQKMQLQQVIDDNKYLHQQNDDMNKYIRNGH